MQLTFHQMKFQAMALSLCWEFNKSLVTAQHRAKFCIKMKRDGYGMAPPLYVCLYACLCVCVYVSVRVDHPRR